MIFVLCLLMAPVAALAQAGESSVEAYANAMKQVRVADQIAALEHYLTLSQNSILKQDALEVLIWDYQRMGSTEHVNQRASDLMKLDPANPVAVAAQAEQTGPQATTSSKEDRKRRIISAQAALAALERLRQPEGMQNGDFAALRRRVESRLNGLLGLAYVDREEYQLARTPLQQAVAVDPGNPQYAYALGLALLYGKESDPANAFLYLARAVNLTEGTAAGAQIAEFSRREYHKAGGKDSDWGRFVVAAGVPASRSSQQVALASNTPPPNPSASSPSAPVNAPGSATTIAPNAAASSPNAATTSTASNPTPNPPAANNTVQPAQRAAVAPPDIHSDTSRTLPPRPEKPQVFTPTINAPNPPVSLGILIETALLTKHNRPAIIATLRDVVSHLRPDDEAAILVFSNQLDFEQDLTANDQLLEQAMNGLHPRPSRALLDGIAFAAGHLKRIGKNANRVLLVITDGRSATRKSESLPLSAQVSGVKIDCIGLNVDGVDERSLLERLASYTGGRASFASGPDQFRMMAVEMTQHLGIPVPQTR